MTACGHLAVFGQARTSAGSTMLEYGVGRAGQKSMMNARRTVDPEEARLLNEYSQAARHFAETVDRLQVTASNTMERFIEALEATGTAHRACERCRIQLKRYTTARMRPI